MHVDPYGTFNGVLVNLFNDVIAIEQKALITEEFRDISVNDMHIIEAVGKGKAKNMTSVAKSLKITVGTLTIAINNLVKKGYVKRERSEEDRRVVLISLTETGLKAFHHHEDFHKDLMEAILRNLSNEEQRAFIKALENLKRYFRNYE